MTSFQKTLSVLTFLLVAVLAGRAPAAELNIVAWNIEWFPGMTFDPAPTEVTEAHIAIVQEELRKMNPDVLLASEIRNWKYFNQAVSVVPGLQVANVSHFVDRDMGVLWRQQLAIASRLPVIASWAEPWRPTMNALVRGFSFAAVEVPESDGMVILFYALHLKSNRAFNEDQTQTNFRIRDESIAQLLEHVNLMERLMWRDQIAGVVIGGDINTNEDGQFGDNVVQMLVDAGFTNTWANTPREKRLTWRGSDRFPPATFDYIFVKGDMLEVGDAEMVWVPEEASDHHAVQLRVKVNLPE